MAGVTPEPDGDERWSSVLVGVQSLEEFSQCLLRLYEESQLDSAEAVAKASRSAGQPISRTTVRNLITGRSRPTSRSLVAFLHGCGVPPTAHRAWIETLHRVSPGRAPRSPEMPPAAVATTQTADIDAATEPGHARYFRTAVDHALAPFAGGSFLALLAQLLDASGWLVVLAVVAGGVGATVARWRWNVSRGQAWGGVALALLGLTGILLSAPSKPVPLVPVMSGDYNLAVARFTNTVGGDVRAEVAAEVANFVPALVQGVRKAIERSAPPNSEVSLLRIEVQEQPFAVSETQPDKQRAEAKEIAAKSNADAVLFGTIGNDGAALVVSPRLWLSPRALPRAEELSGVHPLPSAQEDLTRPDAAIRLRRFVADSAADLATLMELVRLYDSGHYQPALGLVRESRAQTVVRPALKHILAGNLAGKLGRFKDAETAYRAALSDASYQSRARLGLLQVEYSAATGRAGRCQRETDVDALTRVVDGYSELAGTTGVNGANIAAKARFGEARARMCLDAAGHPDGGQGRKLLLGVIGEYDLSAQVKPDDDMRELAAEAEALLGDHDARHAATAEDLSAAVGHLDRATRLTTFTERRVAFAIAQATVLHRAGHTTRACEKLREARAFVAADPAVPAVAGLSCP